MRRPTEQLTILAAALTPLFAEIAHAQDPYPSRAVRIIVPYAAGGTPDSVARVLAEQLQKRLGQTFFVENRAGANGAIASDHVAAASADGHTLLLASDGPIVIAPLLKTIPDPLLRLMPVNLTAESAFVFMARSDLGAYDLKAVVELAKNERLTFGTAGVGSQHHLAGELLKSLAGIDLAHVPYKGSAEAMGDLIGRRIDLVFGGIPPSLAFIEAGSARAIAVTSEQRSGKLPNVPTFKEAGYDGYKVAFWAGVMAPAGTPAAVIDKLHQTISSTVTAPDVARRFEGIGVDALNLGPNEFAQRIETDKKMWGDLISRTNLRK